MEDEYKVVCALSNSITFDDLGSQVGWPRTQVSRSQCSLKANISQTVHPIHPMFGSRLGFRGLLIEWCYFRFDNIQDGGWRPSWNNGAVARNLASAGLSCILLKESWFRPQKHMNIEGLAYQKHWLNIAAILLTNKTTDMLLNSEYAFLHIALKAYFRTQMLSCIRSLWLRREAYSVTRLCHSSCASVCLSVYDHTRCNSSKII